MWRRPYASSYRRERIRASYWCSVAGHLRETTALTSRDQRNYRNDRLNRLYRLIILRRRYGKIEPISGMPDYVLVTCGTNADEPNKLFTNRRTGGDYQSARMRDEHRKRSHTRHI